MSEDTTFAETKAALQRPKTYTRRTIEVHTPRGSLVTLHHRDDTSDLATIGSTFRLWGILHDEYDLADVRTFGLLVDAGAHIGSIAIAFLVDNHSARAIAVEPLPENVEMIRLNAESAGVADRLTIIAGAFGTSTMRYGHTDHRYIGNIGGADGEELDVQEVTLAALVKAYGPVDVIKTDCEGGEWSLLAEPAIADVPYIVGEYHTYGPTALHALLDATHDVTTDDGPTGNFRAVRR